MTRGARLDLARGSAATDRIPAPSRSVLATIDGLYRAVVQRQPDALAVVCGDQRLTYADLAQRTSVLATRLRKLGVCPERRVALVLDRSIELAVATLAIIEAGGAFVPLDPSTPAPRIRALAAAAGADLMLTRRSLRPALGELGGAVIEIDDEAGERPSRDAAGKHRPDRDEVGELGNDEARSARSAERRSCGENVRGSQHAVVEDRSRLVASNGATRLLYVMHTSGSTAAPRAVEVEHAASVDQVQCLAADLGLSAADRHLHTASFGFTLAVRQLLLPLCLGGAVVIAREAELADPLALLRAAKRAGVTVLDLVPSRLRAIVAALRALPASARAAAVPERLRLVLTAGERLTAEVAAGWWAVAGTSARVINLYGASEVGGSVAWHEVAAADLDRASIPIGRARTGTTLGVFDPESQVLTPVADGEIGELCVGGPAVARGYARVDAGRARFIDTTEAVRGSERDGADVTAHEARAAVVVHGVEDGTTCSGRHQTETAQREHLDQRCIVNDIAHHRGVARRIRWFRTGDLVRRGQHGSLELVGRLDEEVKIRGVRVQPDAVETILAGVEGVSEVAVVSRDSTVGSSASLVAYVAGRALPRDSALRERVRAELPAVFVPAIFVRVAELPRLPSGKVDRRALRERATYESGGGPPLASAPLSTIERLIARHWEAVLGVAPRGVSDDFFALGGSSLAAFELAGRIGEALGEVPSALVFDRPTLGEQAAWLAERPSARSAQPRLVRGASAGQRSLSFAQERLWLGELLGRAERSPRIHRALRLTGPLEEARLERAMCAVADRHEALRSTFAAVAGRPYQVVHASLPRDHGIVDLTACTIEDRTAEVARHQAVERAHAFDLARGPLWRTRLLRLGPQSHVLLVTIHHLVCDGWSMRRWLEEVSAHYAAGNDDSERRPDSEDRPDSGGRSSEGNLVRADDARSERASGSLRGTAGRPRASPPALVVQPADVADWQRRCLESGAYDGARAYWREQLAGAAARAELPHDGLRRDPVGVSIEGELNDVLVSRLRARARDGETTLFVVLLAALAQLVAELTGDDDVMLGTLVAGRDRPEVRPLIGLFLNTLPLRVRLDRDAGFAAAFASARDTTRGALAHAELPFERIVAEANPARQARRNPLFDVVLNYLPPDPPATLGELAVEPLPPGPDVAAPFDVMWRVSERADGLQIRIEYRRDRFASERIRDWLARYLELLACAADAA